VKFPIGGKVRERAHERADLVKFQNRQYSLDLKKVCWNGRDKPGCPHVSSKSPGPLCWHVQYTWITKHL